MVCDELRELSLSDDVVGLTVTGTLTVSVVCTVVVTGR